MYAHLQKMFSLETKIHKTLRSTLYMHIFNHSDQCKAPHQCRCLEISLRDQWFFQSCSLMAVPVHPSCSIMHDCLFVYNYQTHWSKICQKLGLHHDQGIHCKRAVTGFFSPRMQICTVHVRRWPKEGRVAAARTAVPSTCFVCLCFLWWCDVSWSAVHMLKQC